MHGISLAIIKQSVISVTPTTITELPFLPTQSSPPILSSSSLFLTQPFLKNPSPPLYSPSLAP